jgi:hypothetical protein
VVNTDHLSGTSQTIFAGDFGAIGLLVENRL